MTLWIENAESKRSTDLLGEILYAAREGARVQFLVGAGTGNAVVQKLRVALSRSRNRNRAKGKKVSIFTLKHEIYPFNLNGRRHDCLVMWTEKNKYHEARELLDDIMERD